LDLTDADREQLFARLSAHAAADHIDLAELERRIARVSDADSRAAALEVLADLPALEPSADPGARSAGAGGARADSDRPRWGRGHGEADAPRADWRPTAERFRDPRTGKVMRVWEDGARRRHYVVED
jgi:hypothetical protein